MPTPIARYDFVPYQRFDSVFNLAVVAFSKAGIDRVEFAISGQGYSGTTPLTSSEMTYNPQTDVYEYLAPLDPSDFSTNGAITVNATVYGDDAETKNLGAISLVVDATGSLSQLEAWVSTTGSDSTGVVGSRNDPYLTVSGAAQDLQTANGGNVSGCIVYLEEGTYDLDGVTPTTNSVEWFYVKGVPDGARANIIIDDGGDVTYTNLLATEHLTCTSSGQFDFIFNKELPVAGWWAHDCRFVGSDRYIASNNPFIRLDVDSPTYFTSCYFNNVHRGVGAVTLTRNCTFESIGEDVSQSAKCMINTIAHDMNPGTTQWHSDGYQSEINGMDNYIVYNYYGTDFHYQGLFLRSREHVMTNNAFVNIFMEMREPGKNGGSGVVLTSAAIYGRWDHLLVWHCTFPYTHLRFDDDTSGYPITNSSFIGNMFSEVLDADPATGQQPSWTLPGNTEGNEFLNNHYQYSYPDGTGSNLDSRSPDSDATGTKTVGDPKISHPTLSEGADVPIRFGYPLSGSPLSNRISPPIVPADALGNRRMLFGDVGALQYLKLSAKSSRSGIRNGERD